MTVTESVSGLVALPVKPLISTLLERARQRTAENERPRLSTTDSNLISDNRMAFDEKGRITSYRYQQQLGVADRCFTNVIYDEKLSSVVEFRDVRGFVWKRVDKGAPGPQSKWIATDGTGQSMTRKSVELGEVVFRQSGVIATGRDRGFLGITLPS